MKIALSYTLKDGYRWEDDSSSPPNYQTKLIDGNLSDDTDGIIDGCESGYYNGTIAKCNYGKGVEMYRRAYR